MGPDLSLVIADPTRLSAIRAGLTLPGRIMAFTSGNTASAIESIRAYRPKLVAIDALFAESPAGSAFADRVEALDLGIAVRLVVRSQGKWVTAPRTPEADSAAPSPVLVASPRLASAVMPANTRRAPRFSVKAPLEAVVEGGLATVVNLSVHGAQIVSIPALRPNQKVKVGLTDTDDMLNVFAQVAWSMYEQSASVPEPFYRVGLEFSGAAQQMLDAYCLRHCTSQPLPVSSR